jgi:hypothetical protein
VESSLFNKYEIGKKVKQKIPLIINKFKQKQGFMDISHEYAKYKRVALELNNLKKTGFTELQLGTLLYNFWDPTDIKEIIEDNDNDGGVFDNQDIDYLNRKLFHFWSYKHYMRCRSLAIKYMKYIIFYDKIILGNYGR